MVDNKTTVPIPIETYNKLAYLGILPGLDNNIEDTRSYNIGESGYSTNDHVIQLWTLWLDYPNLTSFDHDIIKRVLREKEELGFTKRDSRIKDYKKIIHIAKERIRQLSYVTEIK